jgi:hypothetical protein
MKKQKLLEWWLSSGGSSGPALVTAPEILNPPIVGQTLVVQPGVYTGTLSVRTYQWYRDGVAIVGATSKNYVVLYVDEGTDITVIETVYTGVTGTSEAVSVPVVFGRSEVLDAVLPTVNVTFTGSKVSAVNSLKGTMAFTQGTDASRPTVVQLFNGKAFKGASGTIRLVSAAAFPQQYFSAMALVYGSNGSVFSNKNGTGFLNFNITGNLVVIANTGGTVLTGDNSLTSNNTIRTAYWNYAAGGFAVGNDGDEDLINATVISSAPSGAFHILNGNSGANAYQTLTGAIVWFNRALTAPEQDFWSTYLKSRWLYGFAGLLPTEGNALDSVGNITVWGADTNAWNHNSSASVLKGFNDTTKTFTKNSVIRMESPQRLGLGTSNSHETRVSYYGNVSTSGMTRTQTQAQAFTIYGLICVCPYYMPETFDHYFMKCVNGADTVTIWVDRTEAKIKMQSQGAIDSSGLEITGYENFKWILIKAVFNNASSSLTIDVDGVETTVSGTLGGTTGLTGTVEFGEEMGGFFCDPIIFNGTPTTDQDTDIKNLLKAKREALPRYDTGAFLVNDDFNTRHYAFGGITKYSGTYYVVCRGATNHNSMDGVVEFFKSTTPDVSWDAPTVILNATTYFAETADARDPRISALSTGRLIVNVFVRDGTDAVDGSQSYTMYSDDLGVTWSNPVEVAPDGSYFDLRCSGPILELPNGDLLCPCFTEDSGTVNLKIVEFRSTDGGDSWTLDSTIDDINPGVNTDFEESNNVLLNSTTILKLIRQEASTSDKAILKSFGTIDGSNPIVWTTPVVAISDAFGSPGAIKDSTGRVHVTCRGNIFDYCGVYFYSDDDGVTFTQGEFPEPHFDYWVYGSPIEMDDGRIGILWFQQNESFYNVTGKTFIKFKILQG